MLRRTFLASSLAAASCPFPAAAQGPARIGWITAQRESSLTANLKAFRAAMSAAGYVEGQTVEIASRYGDDDAGRVPEFVAELARLPVSVIVTQGVAVSLIRRLGTQIPVIYITSGDPVIAGYAESLAKPLGNMTGLTLMVAELNIKRMELLKQIIPTLDRVAVLANPHHPGENVEREMAELAGRQFELKVDYHQTRNEDELAAAFGTIARDPPRAMSVFSDGFAAQYRQNIADFAMRHGIAMMAGWAIFTESGALCSYGPSITDSYGILAYYVDRILKGVAPADLPIQQPTRFELVINARTARALALDLPPHLMLQADRLIDV